MDLPVYVSSVPPQQGPAGTVAGSVAKDVLSMDRQGYHERDHDNHVDGGDGDEDSVDHGVNSSNPGHHTSAA